MIHNDCDEAYITTIQREKIPSRSSGKRTECHPVRHGRITRRSNYKLNNDPESDEILACAYRKDHFYSPRKKKIGSDKRNAICYKATIEQEIISSACPNKKARNSKDQCRKSRQIKQTILSSKESTSSMSFHATRPDINDEYSGNLCDSDVSFSDDYDTISSSSESSTSSGLFSSTGQRINCATTGNYEPAECYGIFEMCDSNVCVPRREENIFPSSCQQRGYLSEPSFYEEPYTSSRRGFDIETVPKRCVLTNIEPAVWDSDYPPDRAFISPPLISCYCNEGLQSRMPRQRIQNSSSFICHNRESKTFATDPDVVHTRSMVRQSNLPDKEYGDVNTIDLFKSGRYFSHSSGGTSISHLDIPNSTVSNRSKSRTVCQNSLSPNINAKYRKDGMRYPMISIQQDVKLSLKNKQKNGGLKNVDTAHVTEDRLEENDKSAGMEIRIDIGKDRRPRIEYICNPRDILLELPQTPTLPPKSDLSHGRSSMNLTSNASPSYKHSPLATEVRTSDCTFMEITPAANKVLRPWQIPKNRVLPQNETPSAREVTDEQYFTRKEDVSPKTVTIKPELDSDPRDSSKEETILTSTELTRPETNLNVERVTSTKPEFEPFKSSTASYYPEKPHATAVPIRIEGEKRVVFSEPAKPTKLPGTSVPDLYTKEPEKPPKDSLPKLKALISQINHFVGSRTSVPNSTSSDLEYVAQLKAQMENMKNTMNDWRSCAIPLDNHQSKTLEGGGGKRITDRPGGVGSSIIMEVDNELRRLEDNFFQLEQKCLKLGLPFVSASKEGKFEIGREKRNLSQRTAQKNTFLHEFNERVQKLLNMTTLFHSHFPDENIVQETAAEASETMTNAAKTSTPKKGPCSVCRKEPCVCNTKQREELSTADQIVKRLESERSDNIKEYITGRHSLKFCTPKESPCATIDISKPAKDVKQSCSLNLAQWPENNNIFVNEGTPTKTACHCSGPEECLCKSTQGKASASGDKYVKFTDCGTPGSVTKSVKENYPLKTTCQFCRTKHCICKATQTSADKMLCYEETNPDADTDDEMHAVLSTVIKDIRDKLVTVEDDLLSCKTNISQLNRKIDHSSKETVDDVENLQRSMIATMKDLVDTMHSLRSIGIIGQIYCGGQNSADDRELVIGASRMEAIRVKEEEDEFKDAKDQVKTPFPTRAIFSQGYGAVKKSTKGTDEKCDVTQCDCIEKEVQVLTAMHLTKEKSQKPCTSCGNTDCKCVVPIMKVISKICNLLLEYKPLENVSPNSEPISPEVHPQCVCGKSTPELPSGVSQIRRGIHSETQSLDAKLTGVCKECGLPQCECERCLTNQMTTINPEGDITIKRASEKETKYLEGKSTGTCKKKASKIDKQISEKTTCMGCGLPQCVCKRCLTNQMAAVVPEGDSKIKSVSEKGTSIFKSSVALPQGCVCCQIPSQVQNMLASEGDSRVESEEVKSPAACEGCGKPKCVCNKCLTDKKSAVALEGDHKITRKKSSVTPSQGCAMAQCMCGSTMNEIKPQESSQRDWEPKHIFGSIPHETKSAAIPSKGSGMAQCVCGKCEVTPIEGDSPVKIAHPSEIRPPEVCKKCGKRKGLHKKGLTEKKSVVASEGDHKITSKKSSVALSQGCEMAQCACGKSEVAPLEGDSPFKSAHSYETTSAVRKGCGKSKCVCKKCLTDKKSLVASEVGDKITTKKSSVAPTQGCGLAQCACGKSEVAPLEGDSPIKNAHSYEITSAVCKGCGKPNCVCKKYLTDKKSLEASEVGDKITTKKSSVAPTQGCGMAQCACGKSEVTPSEGDSPIKSAHSYEITSAVCKGCGKPNCVCKKCLTDKKSLEASEVGDKITTKKSSVAPTQGCGMAQCACGKSEVAPLEGDSPIKSAHSYEITSAVCKVCGKPNCVCKKCLTDKKSLEASEVGDKITTKKSSVAPTQGCGMAQCACGKSEVAHLEGDSPIKSAHSYEITSAVCKGCGKPNCVCKKCLTDKKSLVASEVGDKITTKKSSVAPTQGCGMAQCACGKSEVTPSEGDSPIKSAHSYEITSAVCKGCEKPNCVCKKCLTDKKSLEASEVGDKITTKKSSVAPTQGCGMAQCACGKSEVALLEGDSPIKSAHSYEITSAVCKGCGKPNCVCKKCLTDKKSVVALEGDQKITRKKSSVAPSQGCAMAQCMCGSTMNEIKPQESSQGDREPKHLSKSSTDGTSTPSQGCGMSQCACGKSEVAHLEGDSPIKSVHSYEITSSVCKGCGKSKCVCTKCLTEKKSVLATEVDNNITKKKSSILPSQGCGMAQCMCGKSPSIINVGIPTGGVSRIKFAPPSDSKSLESKSPAACKGCGKHQCVCKKCLADKKSVLATEVDNNITKKKSSILPSQGCGMAQCMCGRNMSGIESSPDEIKSYVASSQGCGMPQCACERSQTVVKSHIPLVGDGQQKSQTETSTDETDTQITPSDDCGKSLCVCGKSQTEGCGLSQCICKVCLTKERSMSSSGKNDQVTSVPGNVSGSIKAFVRSSEGCGMPACTCGRSSSPEEIKSSIESLKGCRMPQCGCGKSQVPSQGDKESKSLTEKISEGITSREASYQRCGKPVCACGQSLNNISVPTSEGDNQIKSMSEGCGKSRCTCGRTGSIKSSALVNKKERTRDKTPHSTDENKDISSHPCGLRECESENCLNDCKYVVTEEEDEFKDAQTCSENEEREDIPSKQCGRLKSVCGKASSRGCGKSQCACKEIPVEVKGSSNPQCTSGEILSRKNESSARSLEGCGKPGCICAKCLTDVKSALPLEGDGQLNNVYCGKDQCSCGNIIRGIKRSHVTSPEGCCKAQCICGQDLTGPRDGDSKIRDKQENMKSTTTACQNCGLTQCMCGNGLNKTSKIPSERALQVKLSSKKCKNCGKRQCVCDKTAKNSSPVKSDSKKRTDNTQNVATSSQGCSLLQCGCEKRQTHTDCRSDNAQGGCNKVQCVCGKIILISSEKIESEDSNNSSATNSSARSSKKNKGKSKKRSSKRRGSESKEENEPEPEGCGTANCTCNDTAIAGQTAANNEVPVPGWFTNPFIVDYSTVYSLASNQPERDSPNSVLETLHQSLIPTQENQSQVSGNKAVTNYQYATVFHRTNPFYSDYGQPTLMESAGGIVTNNETVTDVKNFGKHLHNQYAAISFKFGSDSAVSNLLSPPFMKINHQQTHPQLSLPTNESTVSFQGEGAEAVQTQASLLNQTISSQQTDTQNSPVILTEIVNHLDVLVQEMSKNKDEITQLSSKMSEQLKNVQSTSSKRLTGSSLIVKSRIHRAKEANALEYQELQRIERSMTSAIATLTKNVDGMNAATSLAESERELKNIEMRLQQAEEELEVSLPSEDSDEFDKVD